MAHWNPKGVRELLDQTAPCALASLAQPPRLLGVAHLLCGAVFARVDDQVAEGVARAGHAAGAHDEQPVCSDVAVEPPDVGVVDPDPVWYLWCPGVAVHRDESCGLECPVVREGAGVLRHAF